MAANMHACTKLREAVGNVSRVCTERLGKLGWLLRVVGVVVGGCVRGYGCKFTRVCSGRPKREGGKGRRVGTESRHEGKDGGPFFDSGRAQRGCFNFLSSSGAQWLRNARNTPRCEGRHKNTLMRHQTLLRHQTLIWHQILLQSGCRCQ